jgi:hypothetical protein
MGQALVAEPGKTWKGAEAQRRASRLIVDDYGDVVALEHRCSSCRRWRQQEERGWCRGCRALRDWKRRRDDPGGVRAKRSAQRRERIALNPDYARREYERHRAERKRRRARDPEREQALDRARQARYRERLRSSPETRRRQLEELRIDNRVRRERLGLPTGTAGRRSNGTGKEMPRQYVPVAPMMGHVGDAVSLAGVSERLLRAWRTGERHLATWDAADSLLLAINRCWWEVFDPADAEPCETFSGKRGRDVVAWLKAADMAMVLWETQPAVGECVKLNRNTWVIESWDEALGEFWLRRKIDGMCASFATERLEELL